MLHYIITIYVILLIHTLKNFVNVRDSVTNKTHTINITMTIGVNDPSCQHVYSVLKNKT